jgi:Phytanoyl-CoA dioxygenase (PhyH)
MVAELTEAIKTSNAPVSDQLLRKLETEGIVRLPNLLSDEQLSGMQRAFDVKLKRLRWNNLDGYEKNEPYRHMVENLLLLDQGFVEAALHPTVKAILNGYLGDKYELVEARGWRSLPTKRDFHGWHGDAWYDQSAVDYIPREVKLAVYLTDVHSGGFNYIKGSHRKQAPHPIRTVDLPEVPASEIEVLDGPAGSAFMFDTSGIHRQSVPMLKPRHALFYNYHDPDVRLSPEDIEGDRYHPLLLNAAFLGNLTSEDQRILGFGNKTNFIPAFDRPSKYKLLHSIFSMTHNINLRIHDFRVRVATKLKHS